MRRLLILFVLLDFLKLFEHLQHFVAVHSVVVVVDLVSYRIIKHFVELVGLESLLELHLSVVVLVEMLMILLVLLRLIVVVLLVSLLDQQPVVVWQPLAELLVLLTNRHLILLPVVLPLKLLGWRHFVRLFVVTELTLG